MLFALRSAKPRPGLWKLLAAATVFLVLGTASVVADAIVHSFNAKGNLQPGWVVALDKSNQNSVVLAPADDPSRIYGVVIDPNDAPLTVQKQAQQVFVATSGNYPVLVSTSSGPIKAGDYLSVNRTDGIAAKAGNDDLVVIGRALEGFNGGASAIVYANDGSALGRIAIQVSPGRNPVLREAAVPKSLRRVSESIAGKSVSVLRIYAALAIFLIAALMATVLLWGGIRNSLIAIGRNPLSKHSIMRGLISVITVSVGVLIIGLFGVYLLLKI